METYTPVRVFEVLHTYWTTNTSGDISFTECLGWYSSEDYANEIVAHHEPDTSENDSSYVINGHEALSASSGHCFFLVKDQKRLTF